MNNPTPDEIKAARLSAGLTQTEAAAMVYSLMTSWQRWEYGTRKMKRSTWELFLLKTKDFSKEK